MNKGQIRKPLLIAFLIILESCTIHSSLPFICFNAKCNNSYSKKPGKGASKRRRTKLKKYKKTDKNDQLANRQKGKHKHVRTSKTGDAKNSNLIAFELITDSNVKEEKRDTGIYKIESIRDTIEFKEGELAKNEIEYKKMIIYFPFDNSEIVKLQEEKIVDFI
jgi:hypothetical protein